MRAGTGGLAGPLMPIHEEILRILTARKASYATPIPSEELATALNVAPSYVRQQVAVLRAMRVVGVRRGRGGGYYLRHPAADASAAREPERPRRSGSAGTARGPQRPGADSTAADRRPSVGAGRAGSLRGSC